MPRRDVGRNDPCPCGSGAKYKHCCLREQKKKRRRQGDDSETDSGQDSETNSTAPVSKNPAFASSPRARLPEPSNPVLEHHPSTCEGCRRLQELVAGSIDDKEDLEAYWDDIDQLPSAYRTAARCHQQLHHGDTLPPGVALDLRLAFRPWEGRDDPARKLRDAYALFGDEALGGSRMPIRRAFEQSASWLAPPVDVYEALLRDTRFLAFRTDEEGPGLRRIEPLTGRTDDEPFDVFDILHSRDAPVGNPGVYAGWVLEWRAIPVVVFPEPIPEHAADLLVEAADEQRWGGSPDDFRRIDYEADVLTAAGGGDIEVREGSDGRIFRSEYADADVLGPPSRVRELYDRLYNEKLPSDGERVDWRFAVAEATDPVDVEDLADVLDSMLEPPAIEASSAEIPASMRLSELDLPSRARTTLGREGIRTLGDLVRLTPIEVLRIRGIGDKTLQSIRECLDSMGLELGTELETDSDRGADPLEEASFDGADFLEWLGLASDGSLDHPRTSNWRRHPVRVLDLTDDLAAELASDLSIDRALDRADSTLAPESAGQLREAVERHRGRVRWLALLDIVDRPANYLAGGFTALPVENSYRHRLAGVECYFPESFWLRPLEELPDVEEGRYRNRLAKNIDAEADIPRVRDLPPTIHALESLRGIGDKTTERTVRGVEKMLEDWPEDVDTPDLDDEASEKVAQGLDEIDSLFD